MGDHEPNLSAESTAMVYRIRSILNIVEKEREAEAYCSTVFTDPI